MTGRSVDLKDDNIKYNLEIYKMSNLNMLDRKI